MTSGWHESPGDMVVIGDDNVSRWDSAHAILTSPLAVPFVDARSVGTVLATVSVAGYDDDEPMSAAFVLWSDGTLGWSWSCRLEPMR